MQLFDAGIHCHMQAFSPATKQGDQLSGCVSDCPVLTWKVLHSGKPLRTGSLGQPVTLLPTHAFVAYYRVVFWSIFFVVEKKQKVFWGGDRIFNGKTEIIRTLENLSSLKVKETYPEKKGKHHNGLLQNSCKKDKGGALFYVVHWRTSKYSVTFISAI